MGQPSRWVWGVLLCLTISTTPGSSADSVDPATFDTTTLALAIEITNVGFTASLQNCHSEYSKWMDAEVKMLLDGVYKCDDCVTKLYYGGVGCITYRSGLIATASIIFKTDAINPYIVRGLFEQNIATALLQTKLIVNKEYTSMTPDPTKTPDSTEIPDPTVTSDP
ncbi:unnamed protein product [Gadus morhua 'NCC']